MRVLEAEVPQCSLQSCSLFSMLGSWVSGVNHQHVLLRQSGCTPHHWGPGAGANKEPGMLNNHGQGFRLHPHMYFYNALQSGGPACPSAWKWLILSTAGDGSRNLQSFCLKRRVITFVCNGRKKRKKDPQCSAYPSLRQPWTAFHLLAVIYNWEFFIYK